MNHRTHRAPGPAGKSPAAAPPRAPAPQPYRPPLLEPGRLEDLLDVLGPAQASYGGSGFAL
jgi:hypothetical protein